jgi:hypothetical protein
MKGGYMAALKSMGVLWTKKGPDGKPRYFSGYVNCGILGDIAITIFKNRFKQKESDPDFNIVLSDPKPVIVEVSSDVDNGVDTDTGEVPF